MIGDRKSDFLAAKSKLVFFIDKKTFFSKVSKII